MCNIPGLCLYLYARKIKATAASPKIDFQPRGLRPNYAMCLRTSTVVCQADVAHLDHKLLGRCDPVQFVLSTTFRNLAGNHLRAGASSFPLILMFMSTGQKLGFSLLRTGGGRSRFWPRNFAARPDSRYRCTRASAMCDSPGSDFSSAGVPSEQRTAASPLSWSAARWR